MTAVALQAGVFRDYPWMRGVAYAAPDTILVGPDATRLRVLADGSVEEVGGVPRRWSISADACAIRSAA